MEMFLPVLTQMIGTGGMPRITKELGHVSIVFTNDLGESLRFDYDDGQHCDPTALDAEAETATALDEPLQTCDCMCMNCSGCLGM